MKSTDETSMNFFRLNNISCTLLDLVEGSLKEVGLEAVTKHEYPVPDTEERIAASRRRGNSATRQRRPWRHCCCGRDRRRRRRRLRPSWRRISTIFRKYFAEKWYSTMPMMTVVGRKG
jgi:hypothetical protein